MSADTRKLGPATPKRRPWRARLGVLVLLSVLVALGAVLYRPRGPGKAIRDAGEDVSPRPRTDYPPPSHEAAVTDIAKPRQAIDDREPVAQVEREPWPPDEWVPLFDGWQRAQGGAFSNQGTVHVADESMTLEAPADCTVGIVCERDVPVDDYELHFEAKKNYGLDHAASVVFPVGGRCCLWAINHRARHFGLDMVDGKRVSEPGNPTRRGFGVRDKEWHHYVLRVERTRIRARINTWTIVDVPRAGHTFSLWEGYAPAMPLGFLAANGTSMQVRHVLVRRLGAAARAREPVRELPGLFGDLLLAVDRWDLVAARQAMRRGMTEARGDEKKRRQFDATARALMRRAIAEGRMMRYDRVTRIMAFVYDPHFRSPDAITLGRWAREADRRHIPLNFWFPGLKGLKIVRGDWRNQDKELVCRAPADAVIMCDRVSKEDFSFEADVTGGHGRQSRRFGLFFRSRRGGGRFLYFLVSDVEDRVYVGSGAGEIAAMPPRADGVEVRYAAGRPHYPIATGMTYHLQVICVGRKFACYIDDELVAEGTDESPADGSLGLLAHQADVRFDNVVIRNYAPLPELTEDYEDAAKER